MPTFIEGITRRFSKQSSRRVSTAKRAPGQEVTETISAYRLNWSDLERKLYTWYPHANFQRRMTVDGDHLFESNAAGDRCLNATQDMVKRLLSYHQVPSCYLNLLTFYHLSSGLNDSCGTFIGQHSLRHPGSRLPALDRSEYRFHVSYALRTTACTLEDSEIATRDGLADKQRSRRSANDWVQPQAAIHHQFDLISGAAVWFITTSMKPDLGKKGPGKAVMWADHLGSFFKEEHASAVYKHAHSAFESSLNVHLRLAQWSLGDLSGFIHHSEETLVELTRAYIELGADEYDDKDIQRLGRLMDRVALCLMDISSNRKVFKSLISFYKRQIVEPGHMMSSCDWRDTGRDAVSNFVADMDVFMAELDAITDRATALKEMVKRRTDSNQSNKRMLALTKQGQKEAVVVALFQYIALFFLPMTVVSAVFSTDIVKFQDLSPGQVLSYSPDALNYWLVTTICLTVLTVGVSEVWKYKRRQRDLHEDDNTGRTSSDEEEEEDMEKSFGNSRDKVTRSCDQTAPVTRTQRSRGDSRRDRGGDFGARPEARAEGAGDVPPQLEEEADEISAGLRGATACVSP
ncbi:hypothetical protein Micbo1qcDRAFT_205286 [Microdochium bolleyi]|uniref:CorA-like transporter domain-containing protein n=1 Tax=Microdochium bolleyi TaxID=196109 RepID=A0A136J058_9PEZI|nr:hypothetical protein Micbo1qcDRAFT_205286 [Microdochium bolleyi]